MSNTISSVKALINGTELTLTYNSSTGKYEAQGIAPLASSYPLDGGYYPVSVTATYATGTSTTVNNSTSGAIGTACRFVVRERVAPTISISAPAQDSYITTALSSIVFALRDNTVQTSGYSGINLSSLSLRIHREGDNAANDIVVGSGDMTCTAVTGGYDCSYANSTTLADGNYTISVNVSDNDGNAATTTSVGIVLDTIAPSLDITSPTAGLQTHDSSVVVSGTTSDITSAPVSIAITLNGTDIGAVTVDEAGAFSKTLTLSTIGDNVIVITATDSAGKTTTISRTVYYDTTAPAITAVTITPNPADGGATYLIAVSVS